MSMRKWVRGMAHAKAFRKGMGNVNKSYGGNGSYFSKHWRELAKDEPIHRGRKQRKRGSK